MLQRLTQMWPSLLGRRESSDEDESEALLGADEAVDDMEDLLKVNEAEVLATFKNLSWTRVITVDGYEAP